MDQAEPIWPQWFVAGDAVFPAMMAAIDAAVERVSLETYIFTDCRLGREFRDHLIGAARLGRRVRVMIDALGSLGLPDSFWHDLKEAGGEVKVFNPISVGRLGIRNHRKLLACDGRVAFIGGFNVAEEYEGDGLTRGWCDLGVRVQGALAAQLEASFDQIFGRADLRHRPFIRLRKTGVKRTLVGATEQLLLSGPGRGTSPLYRTLRRDLVRVGRPPVRGDQPAPRVRIVVAYFLPNWRLRLDLQRVARWGGRVQLILAGKSDVALSQSAARSLYQRMLRAGVEIHEYQPQVLHAKMFIVGDAVYLGSANLDPRSLHLNYELMARFEGPEVTRRADEIFEGLLRHSREIRRGDWKKSRTLWARWKEHFASFLLARVDPYLSLRQWRALPK